MAEFISTFITGFQSVVEEDLTKRFPKIKIINLYDGLIHYRFDGDSRELDKIIYFNNNFFVLKTMKGKGLSFPSLVGAVTSSKNYFLVNKGSFRIRFVQENQFAKVDKALTRRAEDYVLANSKLKLDRLSPTNEVWFSIRREGFAFCGELISKREFTEKNLNKGELRPEIAYFICSFADINSDDTILEPFCGYGSIPVQLAKKFRFKKLFISDIEKEKVELTKNRKQISGAPEGLIDCRTADALSLTHIEDKSINLVITDPPWGFYEDIGDVNEFYIRMFKSLDRVLAADGRLIILSARKEELEQTAADSGFKIKNSLHTLVNGKKAGLYYLVRNQ
jgi:tRNA G10  N-methylase Trm11